MSKKLLSQICFIFAAALCFAFEGGGLIQTEFGIDLSSVPTKSGKSIFTSLKNSEKISLWAKQNMDKDGNYNFSIQSSYFFTFSQVMSPYKKRAAALNALDLDLLKFSFLFLPGKNSSLLFDFGRYSFTDSTRIVFDQNIDGLYLAYKQVNVSVFFNAGYTGLLNAYTAPVTVENNNKNVPLYYLSPSFVQTSLLLHLPIGKYRYSLDTEILNLTETKAQGSSKTYLTLSANGAIIPNLFFILSATGSLSSSAKTRTLGLFVNADLAYYFSKYSAKAGINTQWFSGGKYPFDTFTLTSASKLALVQHSDLWKTGVYISVKPLKTLSVGTEFNVLCRGTYIKNKRLFNGIEFTNSINYTLLDDILLGLNIGVLHQEERSTQFLIGLKGIISF